MGRLPIVCVCVCVCVCVTERMSERLWLSFTHYWIVGLLQYLHAPHIAETMLS